jgi:F420-dependent oxidoreductase-like protein
MVEGQNGLNWERWERILEHAEAGGFQCVFRSDHFTNPAPPEIDSLELWTSLTYAASRTQRIEFGPLVSPVTFRHPSMTVRYASAVDDLSNGRLVLGLGAGWQEREHRLFGVPFYDFPTRFEMLNDALEMTQRLYAGDSPVTYEGKHFQLSEATLMPRPRRRTPILIGGNGPRRTLPLAARYADEWNAVFCNLETFRDRTQRLDTLLERAGRVPGDVKRSLMTAVRWARNDSAVKELLAAFSKRRGEDTHIEDVAAMGMFAGTTSMIVDQIGAFADAGCQRLMLQVPDYDDLGMVDTWADEILPQFHR